MKLLLSSILLTAFLLLMMAAVITIGYGIDNLAMMTVFSTDEPYAVEKIAHNLQENRLDPQGFYNYGYVYHSVIFYAARLFQALDYTVDMRFLAALARSVSFASYLLLIFAMYHLMRFMTNDMLFAACFAMLLAATTNFYFWAQYVHPDLLQACLLLLAMLAACRYQTISGALAAAAIAGLAFATKYSGAFLLPFLPLPSLLAIARERRAAQQRVTPRDAGRFLLVLASMIVVFFGVWLITNPTVITNFQEVMTDIRFESTHISIGTSAAEPANPFLWFPVPSQLLATPRDRALLTLLLYSAFVFLHLFLFVRARTPRYLFHLLPYVVALSGAGIALFAQSRKHPARWKLFFATCLTAAILPMTAATPQSMHANSHKYYHPYLRASAWVEQHFPPETSILADVYCYQSPAFANYQTAWGVDANAVLAVQPEVILINKTMSGRWSWKKPGTRFADLQFVMSNDQNHGGPRRIYDLHVRLFAPESPYQIVYEDDDIVALALKRGESQQ